MRIVHPFLALALALVSERALGADWAELGPLLSGTASYVEGRFVATDYALDDRGPGSGATYPAGLENMADLIQVQLALVPGGLDVTAILNGLVDAGVPLLGVAFDSDADPGTGAASLPGGAWAPLDPLGVDVLALLSSDGGEVRVLQGGSWSAAGGFAASVDPAVNVVRGTVPAALLPPLAGSWRAFAVLGIRSGGASWLDGTSPIFDLAFVDDEPPSGWQSARQGQVLDGSLGSANAAAPLDLGRMAAGITELADGTAPGFHTHLYRSALDVPEGIGTVYSEPGGAVGEVIPGFYYGGPYQPYLVWLPDAPLPTPAPLVVLLHGAGGNHLSSAGAFGPGEFDFPARVVFPLGRGELNFYFGTSERDVLDVQADAQARFAVDEDRIVLSGISMGGVGTWRLGVLYPDRWSFLIPFIAPSNYQEVSSPQFQSMIHWQTAQLETLANLPVRVVHGRLDPLTGAATEGPELDAAMLTNLGYEFRYYSLLRRHHEVVPALSNCLYPLAFQRTRVRNPARVVYSVEPALFDQDPLLEIRYDSAYWVSEVRAAAGVDANGEKGTIDVTSLARADRVRTATTVATTGNNFTQGADLCGPNPAVMTQDGWDEIGQDLVPGPPQPTSNGFTAALTQLEHVKLDLSRMSLRTDEPLTAQTSGDGPGTLRLAGPWSGPVAVTRDSMPFGVLSPSDGAVALADDFAGDHVYVLAPDADGDGAADLSDNCPFAANPGQEDTGGLATSTPDGIGNACQCGDVTGDGVVIGQDGFFMTRYGLGFVDPIFVVAGNCDVTGNGLCNGQDGFFTTRAALGFVDPLSLAPQGQNCPNAHSS